MPSCLICYQDSQVFLIPPCNHKNMCWKCCLKISKGSNFNCPFCNVTPKGRNVLVFADEQQMSSLSFEELFKRGVLRSASKDYQYYSNEKVAEFVEERTSFLCQFCPTALNSLNVLKKHLNQMHRLSFCDVCLDNRKCLVFQQHVYSEGQLNNHLKRGEFSEDGEIILYHPQCGFCRTRFYDVDCFRQHLRFSTHLHCHVCEQNFPEFKYVYYKDYEDIQRHFKKSHFMCDQGMCINLRLENVYVSASALEEHKDRVHHKSKKKKQGSEVLNLLLFKQGQEEERIEWDGVGKDMSSEFSKGSKRYELENEEHVDQTIDIRQFYPEKVKPDNRMSLQTITQTLSQKIYRDNNRTTEISLATTPLFCPYSDEVSSLSRMQLERFLRSIFPPKFSQSIILTFFTRRHEYRSAEEYFSEIRHKMFAYHPLTFYYVFPQLIRFMKNENRNKRVMDEFYCVSLRELKINKPFVFHALERYSDIFSLLQEQIEKHLSDLLFNEEMQLEKYKKYLSELNPSFYNQHQSELFYVQKDKMTNLYHMVEKCKTKHLLKMNWLLKIGFSQTAMKTIQQQFYFQTLEQCGEAVKRITIQELALLYAYVTICLQALFDKKKFKYAKSHSYPLFLSHVLYRIPKCIYEKEKKVIEQVERHSLEIISANPIPKNHGVIVNEADHPPLPVNQLPETTEEQFPNLGIKAEVRLISKSARHQKRIKVKNRDKVEGIEQQEFPALGRAQQTPQETSKVEEEEDFPVFKYTYKKEANSKGSKSVNPQRKEESMNVEDSTVSTDLVHCIEESQEQSKSDEVHSSWGPKPDHPQDQSQEVQKQSPQPETNMKAKKSKKRQKQCIAPIRQKKCGENGERGGDDYPEIDSGNQMAGPQKSTEPVGQADESSGWKFRKVKKSKVRLDLSDSEEEVKKQVSKQQHLESKKQKLRDEEEQLQNIKKGVGFQPLSSKLADEKLSIVNQIIQNSRPVEEQPQVKIKKGKKGKHIVITSVNLSQL